MLAPSISNNREEGRGGKMSSNLLEENQQFGASLPYRLRPNKAVDRALFLSLLSWIAPEFSLRDYPYIGMGAEFLEDFRMIHAKIGITEMTSVESDPQIIKRQEFNKPLESINCVEDTIENYLQKTTIRTPTIVWLDYTDPSSLKLQIETFLATLRDCPLGSIVRVTLNANSGTLGSPKAGEITAKIDSGSGGVAQPLHTWRLAKLREKLGDFVPHTLDPSTMVAKEFGGALLKILQFSVDREFKHSRDRVIHWALSTHYADGQPMVTSTAIISGVSDTKIKDLIEKWEYVSPPSSPLKLDLPSLSTKERIHLESKIQKGTEMTYTLPKGKLGEDPVACFEKFYRVFPHYGSVDI
jgi:hypothetical protein